MKKFKKVSCITLSLILMLFIGNTYFLASLYGSIKDQYMETARDCLLMSDFIEISTRLKRSNIYSESDMDINIVIAPDVQTTTSGDTIPSPLSSAFFNSSGETIDKKTGMIDLLRVTMAYNLRNQIPEQALKTDYELLDSIYVDELNRVGLYPKHVITLPGDSVPAFSTWGMWCVEYRLFDYSQVIHRAYITPPLSSILRPAVGVIVMNLLTFAVLLFAVIYLIRTVLKLRSLEELKDDFTNNMTHELKTPITVTYSAVDTLLNCGKHYDAVKRERYLSIALEQLTRLSGLVEGILSMSMERRKSIVIEHQHIALKPFLEELSSLHVMRSLQKQVDINITVIPEDLTIVTDPSHFGNVMNNLIDNAIKYSGESVRIDIKATGDEITIADNGIGIPSRSLPHIFNKFYRVPNGNRSGVRGYGIGLYYVKSIISKLNWSISVKSTSGVGSTFIIKFHKNESQDTYR